MILSVLIGEGSGVSLLAATSQELAASPDYVDIGRFSNVKIDLRYASVNNFMGQNVYGDFRTAYLHKDAAEKFQKATVHLKELYPGWSFIVFDALRPRSVQRVLWAKVKGTKQESYVANPDKGSVHNYGFALDLSLLDEKGQEVDMGTSFDSFQDLAQPRFEEKFLRAGKLTAAQIENRNRLRRLMEPEGFVELKDEWWHFDALPLSIIKSKYKIVD